MDSGDTGNNAAGKQQQQQQHLSTSKRYRGVRMRKWGSWVAEVRFHNSRERLWLGSYPTPEQAARAFDAAVYCLRGPGAALNFPDQPPHIPSASTLNREEIRAAAVRFAHDVPRRAEEAQGGGGEASTGVVSPGEANSRAMAESMEVFPAFYFPGVSGWSNEEEEDVWAAAATASIDDIYRSSPLWNF